MQTLMNKDMPHEAMEKEQAAIIDSFAALKKDPTYLKKSEELDHGFSSSLPNDSDEWWRSN